MFDIAWSELLLIGAVALIFIGPKDLPGLLVNIGRWVRRARSIASEFQSSLDQAVREAEVDALKQKMNAAVMDAEKQMPTIDLPSFSMQLDAPSVQTSATAAETVPTAETGSAPDGAVAEPPSSEPPSSPEIPPRP